MRRVLAPVVLVALAALVLPHAAWAAGVEGLGDNPDFALPTSSTAPGARVDSGSLVENANAWNGRVVSFRGEAIGEAMIRGDMAWIHMNDDAYMDKNIEEGAKLGGYNSGQAVWVPAALAKKITYFGDYKHEGDIIVAEGTFNAACRLHGGDMDIHATKLTIERVGHPIPHVPNRTNATVAAALFVIAGLLWWVRRGAARRRI